MDEGGPHLQVLQRADVGALEKGGEEVLEATLLRQRGLQFAHFSQAVAAETLGQGQHHLFAIADVVAQQTAGQARFVGDLLQRRPLDTVARHTAGKGGQDFLAPFRGYPGPGHALLLAS